MKGLVTPDPYFSKKGTKKGQSPKDDKWIAVKAYQFKSIDDVTEIKTNITAAQLIFSQEQFDNFKYENDKNKCDVTNCKSENTVKIVFCSTGGKDKKQSLENSPDRDKYERESSVWEASGPNEVYFCISENNQEYPVWFKLKDKQELQRLQVWQYGEDENKSPVTGDYDLASVVVIVTRFSPYTLSPDDHTTYAHPNAM